MKTAHFLWLGWRAFAVVGAAHAAPLLTGHFDTWNPSMTLAGPGAGQWWSEGQSSSFSFVHEPHNEALENPTFSRGTITLTFSGAPETGPTARSTPRTGAP